MMCICTMYESMSAHLGVLSKLDMEFSILLWMALVQLSKPNQTPMNRQNNQLRCRSLHPSLFVAGASSAYTCVEVPFEIEILS